MVHHLTSCHSPQLGTAPVLSQYLKYLPSMCQARKLAFKSCCSYPVKGFLISSCSSAAKVERSQPTVHFWSSLCKKKSPPFFSISPCKPTPLPATAIPAGPAAPCSRSGTFLLHPPLSQAGGMQCSRSCLPVKTSALAIKQNRNHFRAAC